MTQVVAYLAASSDSLLSHAQRVYLLADARERLIPFSGSGAKARALLTNHVHGYIMWHKELLDTNSLKIAVDAASAANIINDQAKETYLRPATNNT